MLLILSRSRRAAKRASCSLIHTLRRSWRQRGEGGGATLDTEREGLDGAKEAIDKGGAELHGGVRVCVLGGKKRHTCSACVLQGRSTNQCQLRVPIIIIWRTHSQAGLWGGNLMVLWDFWLVVCTLCLVPHRNCQAAKVTSGNLTCCYFCTYLSRSWFYHFWPELT